MQASKKTESKEKVKHIIINELPQLFKKDEKIRKYILNITKDKYAEKEKTEDRIDRILNELKVDRERQDKRWEETNKRIDTLIEEGNRRWEETNKRIDTLIEEGNRRWEENQKVINEMLISIKGFEKRFESSIGALGARWGLRTEASFRNGLKAILENSFNVKVERYADYDNEGIVFGKPDQVELDIIVHNNSLILCEIKSSMSKSDMYAFWRKVEFYEKRHDRKPDRTIVISPMVDPRAQEIAKELKIEVYSFADEVEFS